MEGSPAAERAAELLAACRALTSEELAVALGISRGHASRALRALLLAGRADAEVISGGVLLYRPAA